MQNDLKIVFQDKDIIAVNKPAGMPVQPDPSGDRSVLYALEKQWNKPLHLINRIDRPASGLVLLTARKKYYTHIKNLWNTPSVVKEYLAITEGHWEKQKGILLHHLKKGRNNKAIPHKNGKECHLSYQVLCLLDRYTLLQVDIHTGRFHQIRAQLSLSGHPIKGDIKYGARRKNADRSIYLHCLRIQIPGKNIPAALPNHKDPLWHFYFNCQQ